MLYNMCKVERFVLTILKEDYYYYYYSILYYFDWYDYFLDYTMLGIVLGWLTVSISLAIGRSIFLVCRFGKVTVSVS